MGCGCKNRNGQTENNNNQLKLNKNITNQTIQESIKKTLDLYYKKNKK
jgi:hypothetical protein